MSKTTTPVRPITEIVTSYEAACELTGTTPLTIEDFAKHPLEDQDSDFAAHQLNVISKAFREGVEFDYADTDQKKWFPWFYWNVNRAGGPGFSCNDYRFDYSDSFVSARHSYPSEDTAEFAGTHFENIYNRFLAPYQPK
jgi:hypothetical protein